MKLIAIPCFLSGILVTVAADIWPRRDTRQPSFRIISIREQRVELQHESDGQIMKMYAVDVAADNGVWKLVIDRENRVVAQRFFTVK